MKIRSIQFSVHQHEGGMKGEKENVIRDQAPSPPNSPSFPVTLLHRGEGVIDAIPLLLHSPAATAVHWEGFHGFREIRRLDAICRALLDAH